MPSALTQSAPPVQLRLQRWNTLQLLRTIRIGLLALDALLLGAVLIGADVHRHAMQIIGNDTAPSIIAAQRIKAALAGMDADLAHELLVPSGQAVRSPGAYDDRRVEAAKALIEAARNITYGDSERVPIEALQVSAGTYQRLAQQSRDLADDGQGEMSTRFYRADGIIMDGTLLPAADDLDKANNDVLEREYESKSTRSLVARLLTGFAGLLALLALAATQVYLSRRTRRTLNPALLAASILALWLTVYAFSGMGSEEHDLKVARQDAFTSIGALWRARATAYSANGAESRYLLDPLHAREYEAEFVARTNALAQIPPSLSADRVIAAASAGSATPGFTGFLADELNNITFQGEREAAVQTLEAWESYMAIDAQIRTLERTGQHQRAVELCIGTSPGQSNWAFSQFDKALQDTLDINQHAFDGAVAEGFLALRNMEYKAAGAAALIAILITLGLAPRIREYE
jgi:hypothetical protein